MMNLYAIVDEKARAVVSVFQSQNDDAAIRSLMQLLTVPEDNVFNQAFRDFNLYALCSVVVDDKGVSVKMAGFDQTIPNKFNLGFDCSAPIFMGSSLSEEVLTSRRQLRFELRDKIFSKTINEIDGSKSGDLDA